MQSCGRCRVESFGRCKTPTEAQPTAHVYFAQLGRARWIGCSRRVTLATEAWPTCCSTAPVPCGGGRNERERGACTKSKLQAAEVLAEHSLRVAPEGLPLKVFQVGCCISKAPRPTHLVEPVDVAQPIVYDNSTSLLWLPWRPQSRLIATYSAQYICDYRLEVLSF
mmetsp:Transcript_91002/g.257097  ORF Transcript_91002/g.257097 Transcript_91002/m.257097 type:complete len:166 (-) Transcript_91002:178-675(-)